MKFKLHNSIKLHISQAIAAAIKANYPEINIDEQTIYHALGPTPNPEAGDIAFPCFLLAKPLKSSPAKIATDLEKLIQLPTLCKSANSQGPYLNFYLEITHYWKELAGNILSGSFFNQKIIESAPKTMVEFSQPNTHKEMHVGHMRNLCLGDALIRILRQSGVETLSTTFPGDVGTHVAKCLWYLKNKVDVPVPENRKGAWLGSLYTAANNLLEDQKGSDNEAKNKTELTEILKQIEKKMALITNYGKKPDSGQLT